MPNLLFYKRLRVFPEQGGIKRHATLLQAADIVLRLVIENYEVSEKAKMWPGEDLLQGFLWWELEYWHIEVNSQSHYSITLPTIKIRLWRLPLHILKGI